MNPGTSDTSDFQALHATPELIPLYDGSLCPLDSYTVMLYWFFGFLDQQRMTT